MMITEKKYEQHAWRYVLQQILKQLFGCNNCSIVLGEVTDTWITKEIYYDEILISYNFKYDDTVVSIYYDEDDKYISVTLCIGKYSPMEFVFNNVPLEKWQEIEQELQRYMSREIIEDYRDEYEDE